MIPLLAAAIASVGFPPALRGRELSSLPTRRREVVLTFDAGSGAQGAWPIVTTLVRKRVPATFFLTGRWIERYPRVARVIGAHFEVGNHTFTHSTLTSLPSAEVSYEIRRGAGVIRRLLRVDPRPFFRFPYGASSSRTISIANHLGYLPIRWSVDSLGWMPGQTPAAAAQRVVAGLRPGAIVLMHLGGRTDARALPAIVAAARRRGYEFTNLARLRRGPRTPRRL